MVRRVINASTIQILKKKTPTAAAHGGKEQPTTLPERHAAAWH
jgi:hypothetical protein